jgi:hypothetical protein
MSILNISEVGKLKVKVYDSRAALGEEAAKEAGARIKELLSTKKEINIIFAGLIYKVVIFHLKIEHMSMKMILS